MRRSFRVFVFEELGRWDGIHLTANCFADEVGRQYQSYEAHDTEELKTPCQCQPFQIHRRLSRETGGCAESDQDVYGPWPVGPGQPFRLEGRYHSHAHPHHHSDNKSHGQGMSGRARQRGVSKGGSAGQGARYQEPEVRGAYERSEPGPAGGGDLGLAKRPQGPKEETHTGCQDNHPNLIRAGPAESEAKIPENGRRSKKVGMNSFDSENACVDTETDAGDKEAGESPHDSFQGRGGVFESE